MTSRFPISPDLCPWSWPPPIGQALCLPTRPLGSHLWTRVRQQIYPASSLIPLLEQLPLASPELPPALLFLTNGYHLLDRSPYLPVRSLKALSYLQSVRQFTLPRAQFNINSPTASGKSQTSPALLSWPMVTTYWTGLLPSSQASWTLPYSQSVKSTLLRAQFINNSHRVTSEAHQMSGFPFHQMVTSLVTLNQALQ